MVSKKKKKEEEEKKKKEEEEEEEKTQMKGQRKKGGEGSTQNRNSKEDKGTKPTNLCVLDRPVLVVVQDGSDALLRGCHCLVRDGTTRNSHVTAALKLGEDKRLRTPHVQRNLSSNSSNSNNNSSGRAGEGMLHAVG